jgi:hypothetical protein
LILIASAGCNQQDLIKIYSKQETNDLGAISLRDLRNTSGERAFNPFMPNSPMLPYEGNNAGSQALLSLDKPEPQKLPACDDAECNLPVDIFRFALDKDGLNRISTTFGEAYVQSGKIPEAAMGAQWAALLGSSIYRIAEAYSFSDVSETSKADAAISARYSLPKNSSYHDLIKAEPAGLVDYAATFWTDYPKTLDEAKRRLFILKRMSGRMGGDAKVKWLQGRQIEKTTSSVAEELIELEDAVEEWPLGEAVNFPNKESIPRFSKEAMKNLIQKEKSLLVLNGAFLVTGYSENGDVYNVFDPYSGKSCKVKIYRNTYSVREEIVLDSAPPNVNYRTKCDWAKVDGSLARRRVCKFYVDFTQTVQGIYTLSSVQGLSDEETEMGATNHCSSLTGLEIEHYFVGKMDLGNTKE